MDLEEEFYEGFYEDGTEELPVVLDDPKTQVYLPIATTKTKGIASFDAKDFNVDPTGKVALNEDLHQIKENTDTALETSQGAKETADSAKETAEEALQQAVEGLGSKIYVNGVLESSVNVDKDIQEQFNQLTEDVEDIKELVPGQASSQNQLADKNFVNSSINAIAAFYITYDSQGNPFPTKAALSSATTFYSGGETRVPTRNDYCLVLADETHDNASCRYVYSGEYPNGQWDFQFIVNESPFTSDQVAAINSGITSSLVQQITANQNAIATKVDASELNNYVTKDTIQEISGAKTFTGDNIYKTNGATYGAKVPDTTNWNANKTLATIDNIPTPTSTQSASANNNHVEKGYCNYWEIGNLVLVILQQLVVKSGTSSHNAQLFTGLPAPKESFVIIAPSFGNKENFGLRLRVSSNGDIITNYTKTASFGDTTEEHDITYCYVKA